MRYGVLGGLALFAILALRGIEGAQLAVVATLGFAQIGVARLWLPDRFTRFVILWAFGALCFYGWAQEKVPWLLVPQVLPLGIIAAVGVSNLVTSGALRRAQTAIPLGIVSALTIWTLIASNYLYDAPIGEEPKERRHSELLAYVQSTYDIPRVNQRIEAVAAALETGTQTRLQVSGDATWPMSWYLRHYPVNWGANVRNVDTPVVIVDPGVRKSLEPALSETYEIVPFEIRGWWEPNWREATPPNVLRFLFTRRAWNPAGSSDAVMFVHKNPQRGMQFAKIAVDPPPSARAYPEDPSLQEPVAVWGTKGAASGQFNEPRGLATDPSGNLYVVDSKNNRIQKLSAAGAVVATWGSAGSGEGELKDPCGIAIGPDGNVYVADTWNHRIQKFDANGRFLRQWAPENPGFWGPRGIVVANDGKVFVTDTGNKRVVSFTSEGEPLGSWGTEGSKPGQFIEPVGIGVDAEGNVVVVDTGNRRLQFFRPDETFLKEVPVYGMEEFYTEPYLSIAGAVFYITDSYNHRFARYRDGNLTGTWGKSGSGNGEFNRPIGIAADTSGNVYVSDTMNHRIQKYSLGSDE
jgi:sugar lactone lactonase YvrE